MDDKIKLAAEGAPAEAGVSPAEVSVTDLDSKTGLLKKRRKVGLDTKRARAGYVFVLPFIIGVVCIYLPILLDSIWFSISNSRPGQPIEIVGLAHYKSAFGSQPFITQLVAGIQQLVFEIPAVIIFSLFIAVVLNQKMLGRAVFRAIFFVPVIIATGLMESINATDRMDDATAGGINSGSGSGGSSEIISVLDIENLFAGMAVGAPIVAYVVDLVNNVYNIINYSGVQMLIFLAGLQSISPSIYEACQIEGATGWETFWKITFPMISPMILVNSVYTTIDAFTRTQNPAMIYISDINDYGLQTAMYWIYFLIVILIIGAIAAIASTFIFYQRRD